MATFPKKLQLILNDIFFFIVFLPILYFLSIGVILCFALVLSVASNLGTVTTLSCKRIEPTTVNCTRKRSVFFGLIQQKSTSLFMVTEAKFKTKVTRTQKGKIEANSVTLVTKQGESTVFNSGDKTEMKVLADRTQAFINSTEPSLILQRDLRRNWGVHIASLMFLFIFSFMLCLVGGLWLIFAFFLGWGIFSLLTDILILIKKIFRIS